MDAVQITGEKSEPLTDACLLPEGQIPVKVNGELQLQVSVEFRKNGIFSQYDVDVYCDDVSITKLPHGKNYEGIWLVSEGSHMITFCRSGDKSVRGTCSIQAERDASFSCRIVVERNKVAVSNEKLTR